MKIVFLDRDTMSPRTVVRAPAFDHVLEVFDRTTAAQVGQRIADADIVITNKVKLTAADIEGAPRLRLVAIAATGSDNIDLRRPAASWSATSVAMRPIPCRSTRSR